MGYFPHRTNVGLVESEDGLYIIDTGDCELDGKDIIESCMVLFPEKKIKAILNTHSHLDHSGGNFYITNHTDAQIVRVVRTLDLNFNTIFFDAAFLRLVQAEKHAHQS